MGLDEFVSLGLRWASGRRRAFLTARGSTTPRSILPRFVHDGRARHGAAVLTKGTPPIELSRDESFPPAYTGRLLSILRKEIQDHKLIQAKKIPEIAEDIHSTGWTA